MALINYATEVLADGPIGYWRLAETSLAQLAADASAPPPAHKNDGTYSSLGITLGLPGFGPPGGDKAALFDGVSGRIVVLNSDSLNPTEITMEAKVRWDGPSRSQQQNGSQQRILEKASYPGVPQYNLIIDGGYVRVELRLEDGPNNVLRIATAKSGQMVALGAETHIVATYNGKAILIYLNGMPDTTTTTVVPGGGGALIRNMPPSGGRDLGIGNEPVRERPFNGLIDEVALFDKALSADRILAHYQSQFAKPVTFQYAAKFVCGKSAGTVVAPGAYFTAVNVHNPTYTAIRFRAKIAVALPGLKPGPVSKFFDAKLGPDEALEIDCPDIHKHAETKSDFLKGFVVIESGVELDVVAVYTAAGRDGQVETLHTERVPARRLELGLPDLIPVPDAIQ